ncbi:MAG: hypothetical protein K9I94_06085 [Bacteroidales bacterium]|nr:hypothetical protein [Bacteroidales bacterium]
MKRSYAHNFILGLVIATLMFSCVKEENYPVEPEITFEQFLILNNDTTIDERGVLKFSFTDGDGDIGLTNQDTAEPYKYNLFISYFERRNGTFEEVFITVYNPETEQEDTITFNSRIPMLLDEGVEKPISGTIEDTLFINNYNSPYDTIRFEAYIVDRELHKSNTIQTPPIIINK